MRDSGSVDTTKNGRNNEKIKILKKILETPIVNEVRNFQSRDKVLRRHSGPRLKPETHVYATDNNMAETNKR